MAIHAVVAGVLAQACPAGRSGCAPASTARQKPLFEGFGVHEVLVIGAAALATLAGLIVVAWLLVRLTGAHRDYTAAPVELPPLPAGSRAGVGYGTPRPRKPPISPSTWVLVGLVVALAIGAATWVTVHGNDDKSATPTTTTRAATTTTVPAATTTSLPSDCARPGVVATVLPAGFDKVLLPGLGLTGIASTECAYHWAGPNAVVAVLPTGYSPLGPPGEAQQTVRRGGRTMYVGRTPQGATGLVIEDREMGGAPDIWFTLLSNTVSAEDLINIAAGLQRG